MDFLAKGENTVKVNVGYADRAKQCSVFCSKDDGCSKWSQCVHPTVYSGCSGGTLYLAKKAIARKPKAKKAAKEKKGK